MKRRAFTAVEALLTLGVIAITAGLSVPMYRNYQIRSDLDLAVEQTIHGLNSAQLLSRAGEDDSEWGYQVEEGTVFRGEAYPIRDSDGDRVVPLPPSITVSGITEVMFTRVTGEPSPTGDIILEALNGQQRIVTVQSDGSFSSSGIITPEYGDDSGEGDTAGAEGGASTSSASSEGSSTTSTSTESSTTSTTSSTASTGASSENSQGGTSSAGGTACEDRFTVAANGTLETTGSVHATFKALGSQITYGAGGPEVLVTAEVSTNGGSTWSSLFGGAEIDGGEEQTVNSLSSGQQILVRVNGRYGWLFNKTYTSNDNSGHIEVLRNGDTPPAYQAFGNQSNLADFLDQIINAQGKIDIGSYDAVLLVELGTLSTASSDFQDAVILVQFGQVAGSCASNTEPRFKVNFERMENTGTGDVEPVIYMGPNSVAYAPNQWIPLRLAGQVITDTGLVEDVKGLAAQRESNFVRLLLHGSHNGQASNKEIVDARITFENASITQVQNDTGNNAAENPFDGIVNDGAGGDEATTATDNKSVLFQTRVTGEDDSIKIYWQNAAATSSSSSSTSSTSTSSSAGSTASSTSAASTASSTSSQTGGGDLDDLTSDACAAGYTIESGRVILSEKADVTFRVLGTYATYGERGPAIQMRLSTSLNAGTSFTSLFGNRAIKGGETETYRNVALGTQMVLRAEGRRSWLFRETADSDDGDNKIVLLRRGAADPGTTSFVNPSLLKPFLRNILLTRRINIGKRDLLVLVELQGVDETSDYQDAVVLVSIEKPASGGICGTATVTSSNSSASSTTSGISSVVNSSSNSSTSSSVPETQVTICHFPPGNTKNFNTLTVGSSAVAAHLEHGDRLGTCTSDPDGDGLSNAADLCPNTYVPEPVPTESMLFDRYALARNNSFFFVEGPRKKISSYSLTDTRGCSCEQLIDVSEGKRDYNFNQYPSLLRNMHSLFPFYTNGARQFGCGKAILDMIKNY